MFFVLNGKVCWTDGFLCWADGFWGLKNSGPCVDWGVLLKLSQSLGFDCPEIFVPFQSVPRICVTWGIPGFVFRDFYIFIYFDFFVMKASEDGLFDNKLHSADLKSDLYFQKRNWVIFSFKSIFKFIQINHVTTNLWFWNLSCQNLALNENRDH